MVQSFWEAFAAKHTIGDEVADSFPNTLTCWMIAVYWLQLQQHLRGHPTQPQLHKGVHQNRIRIIWPLIRDTQIQ